MREHPPFFYTSFTRRFRRGTFRYRVSTSPPRNSAVSPRNIEKTEIRLHSPASVLKPRLFIADRSRVYYVFQRPKRFPGIPCSDR